MDEEVVALVETDSCAVDAIQYLVGCTFGKGNLIHLDQGKSVFTFVRRSDGKAIRIASKPRPARQLDPEQESLVERVSSGEASETDRKAFWELWRQRAFAVLEAKESELFDIRVLDDFSVPDRASIHASMRCDVCGERTMVTRVHYLEGKTLCTPCYERPIASWLVIRLIGVVHNELGPYESPSRARSVESTITIYSEYAEGLEGIETCQKLQILFCFDRAPDDAPLQQHPMGDRSRPKRGVFALRSPHRPSGIGLTTVTLLGVKKSTLAVAGLDAWDGTPVLDIKPYVATVDE